MKINIGRKDVIWNYFATFLKIGSGVILWPFILHIFPQETVAIWNIFSAIIALAALFDFGFNPSFARNVSYVVSGVKELKTTGFQIVEHKDAKIDYSLFKGLINVMKWFYAYMAITCFIILSTVGTYYIRTVLHSYNGNHSEVYISWVILLFINSYSFYTMYYDSIMQGRGLIKRSKQIEIIGQTVYLIVAIVMISLHFNLIAIVSAQVFSVLIRRILSYYTIYTHDFRLSLKSATALAKREFIKPILPNALKVGLTSIGAFLVLRSSIIIGSLYLPLEIMASYGLTIQMTGIISEISSVFFYTYQPKVIQYRIYNKMDAIKQLYLKGWFLFLIIFIIGGSILLLFGNWALNIIDSKTLLCPIPFIVITLLIYLLEKNHGFAAALLLTKNEVPFFRAALFAGGITFILLIIFLRYTNLGIWGLILAQGIAQGCYQNWKWPITVIKELNVKFTDIKQAVINFKFHK